MRLICLHIKPLQRCQLVAKFTQTRLFLSFLAYCCVHFLTLINNLVAIFQGTFSRHNYAVFDSPRGFVSVVSVPRLYESAAKL